MHTEPAETIATLTDDDARDPVALMNKAHAAVAAVTPMATDRVVFAVARALHEHRRIDRSTVALIVQDTHPLARQIKRALDGHTDAWEWREG